MFVYVCCAGGATSSMLCKKIQGAGAENSKIYMDSITEVLSSAKHLSSHDIILAYGPASLITETYIKDTNFSKVFNLVLISPQVRFEHKRLQALLTPHNIPVETIEMRTFGTMNGGKMLDIILSYEVLNECK